MAMWVAELWRYPVKSLAGEQLESAEITATGIPGDRVVQVHAGGRVVTSRTSPRLLGLQSTLGPDGEPLVEGRPWTEPAATAAIQAAAGPGARLARNDASSVSRNGAVAA